MTKNNQTELTPAQRAKVQELSDQLIADTKRMMDDTYNVGFQTGMLVAFTISIWIAIVMKLTIGDIL